jgi:hypothetical protein
MMELNSALRPCDAEKNPVVEIETKGSVSI